MLDDHVWVYVSERPHDVQPLVCCCYCLVPYIRPSLIVLLVFTCSPSPHSNSCSIWQALLWSQSALTEQSTNLELGELGARQADGLEPRSRCAPQESDQSFSDFVLFRSQTVCFICLFFSFFLFRFWDRTSLSDLRLGGKTVMVPTRPAALSLPTQQSPCGWLAKTNLRWRRKSQN